MTQIGRKDVQIHYGILSANIKWKNFLFEVSCLCLIHTFSEITINTNSWVLELMESWNRQFCVGLSDTQSPNCLPIGPYRTQQCVGPITVRRRNPSQTILSCYVCIYYNYKRKLGNYFKRKFNYFALIMH